MANHSSSDWMMRNSPIPHWLVNSSSLAFEALLTEYPKLLSTSSSSDISSEALLLFMPADVCTKPLNQHALRKNLWPGPKTAWQTIARLIGWLGMPHALASSTELSH